MKRMQVFSTISSSCWSNELDVSATIIDKNSLLGEVSIRKRKLAVKKKIPSVGAQVLPFPLFFPALSDKLST
jgi:hypothetical protein